MTKNTAKKYRYFGAKDICVCVEMIYLNFLLIIWVTWWLYELEKEKEHKNYNFEKIQWNVKIKI